MGYLKRADITISSTGGAAGTGDFYSDIPVSGTVYGVEFIASTGTTALAAAGALPTTATVSVRSELSTEQLWVNAHGCTTDNWLVLPRGVLIDSTGASTAWNSTAYVPGMFPVIGRVMASITGATCADLNGSIRVYVEGGN